MEQEQADITNTVNQNVLIDCNYSVVERTEFASIPVDKQYPYNVVYCLGDETRRVSILGFRTHKLAQLAFQWIFWEYRCYGEVNRPMLSLADIDTYWKRPFPQTPDTTSYFRNYTFPHDFLDDKQLFGWLYCNFYKNAGWKTFSTPNFIKNVTTHDKDVGGNLVKDFMFVINTTELKCGYTSLIGW